MTILINISDMHVGSDVALATDRVFSKDNAHHNNKIQTILLDWWNNATRRVIEFAKNEDCILLVGGDCNDGDGHHDTAQTWGTAREQAMVAAELIAPVARVCRKTYMLRGTRAHTGERSEFDEYVALEIGAETDYHWRLDVDGHLIDWAHHCTLPKDPRSHEAALERQASQIARRYRLANERIPDLILRQHVHRHAIGYSGKIKMVTGLGWKLRDDYLAQIDPIGLYAIGLLVIDAATLEVLPIQYEGIEDGITTIRPPRNEVGTPSTL